MVRLKKMRFESLRLKPRNTALESPLMPWKRPYVGSHGISKKTQTITDSCTRYSLASSMLESLLRIGVEPPENPQAGTFTRAKVP